MTRLLSILALLTFSLASLNAQSAPAFSIMQGYDLVTSRTCSGAENVGSIYTTITNPSVTSVCQQTGANTFGWVSSFIASVTGGTLTIAGGKAPVISKTITFTGTDATTMTFPATSGTVATLGATQNLATTTGFADSSTASKTLAISLSGATASTATTLAFAQSAPRTVTFPDASITVPGTVLRDCGTTATCAATDKSATMKVAIGSVALTSASPSIATITSLPFSGALDYHCTLDNETTRTDEVAVLAAGYVSGASFVITGPNTVTDVIDYVCIGW